MCFTYKDRTRIGWETLKNLGLFRAGVLDKFKVMVAYIPTFTYSISEGMYKVTEY